MQILLYNLFLWLYGLAIRVVALFDEKAARWIAGRKNLYKELEAQLQTKEKRIWFHCASVGEFEQARPLIERLRSCHPSFKIVLTFFSPSGYELRKDYPGADYVFYLPMDGRRRAARFVRLVNPSVAVFVKYEFWYHYLRTLKQSKIPVILVAAAFRPSQPFFQWYGGFFRRMLGFFNHLFVHDKESASLLSPVLPSERITVAGDTRYDRVIQIAAENRQLPQVEAFAGSASVLIGGSTWPADEQVLREVFSSLPQSWKLIIAPHELGQQRMRSVFELFKGEAVFFSTFDASEHAGKRVLIIDNMGMLSALYRYGNVAFIGGGFLKGGIHNTLEPAVFGLPVLFGPVYEKFVEAVALKERGFAFPVSGGPQAVSVVNSLIADEASLNALQQRIRAYILEHNGAADRIIHFVESSYLK